MPEPIRTGFLFSENPGRRFAPESWGRYSDLLADILELGKIDPDARAVAEKYGIQRRENPAESTRKTLTNKNTSPPPHHTPRRRTGPAFVRGQYALRPSPDHRRRQWL